MYGSIRKSYGAKKASRDTEKKERKVLFRKKKNQENIIQGNEYQETSYMNVDASRNKGQAKNSNHIVRQNIEKNTNTGKSEFPIASVILTIVFTMMVMVFAFGFGGV